jgi:transposase
MSELSRYIVDAVVLERRSPTEVARVHGITRRWIHKLVKRFREGGYPALGPAPADHVPALTKHRPKSRPESCDCARSWSMPVTMPGRIPSPIT